MSLLRVFRALALLCLLSGSLAQDGANTSYAGPPPSHSQVLILGGGMAGIIAARTLHALGIDDFVVVDAQTVLGGRMMHVPFGVPSRQLFVEVGPNWVQGTQQGSGPANPIWELALKHNLSTANSDFYGSTTTYDYNGFNNYTDTLNTAVDTFTEATVIAGERLRENLVDMDLRAAYRYMGKSPQTPQEDACDYYQIDFSPSETSWLASAWNNNFTYDPQSGGFADVNQMCIDQRGFSYLVQAEAAEFLKSNQLLLNQTVDLIEYSQDGVAIRTTTGHVLTADHALVTFSAGVLQNTDVVFEPALPCWKREAVNNIEMAVYTKIFLQFNETFWFPTQMGIYADQQRGRYPIWQNLDHIDFFPGSGVIFVTVTGDFSIYVEQMETSQIQAEIMEVLRAMYPNITVPDPIDILVPRWGHNPLFRGSYSNWGASFVPGHAANLRATVDHRLWFAGEATSLKYFGFLQGAYFEGQDVATEIAACIKQGRCDGIPHETLVTNAEKYPSSLVV